MTTIINTPRGNSDEGVGAGFIFGIVFVVAALALFLLYGVPAIRGTEAPQNDTIDVNVELPTPTTNPDPTPTPTP